MNWIEYWLVDKAQRRLNKHPEPELIIGRKDEPYLLRWFVIPRNRFFNIYLHCFCRSDEDFALHDHPWLFNASYIWQGEYTEHTPEGKFFRRTGMWAFRWGRAPHRVELMQPFSCWTVFVTGPRIRKWGFYCPKGWVAHDKIAEVNNGVSTTRGCP